MKSRRAAVALAVIVAGAACAGPEPAPSGDPRTAVVLPVEANLAVRGEMRAMLSALSGILTGLASNDTAAIRVAAHPAGTGEAADPQIERLLPERWMELATAVHEGFDGLATAPLDSVTARLATVMTHCVACHATYRLGSQ